MKKKDARKNPNPLDKLIMNIILQYSFEWTTFDFQTFLFFTSLIILLGIFGIISNEKNILFSLLNIELAYFGLVLCSTVFAIYFQNVLFLITSLIIMIITACESAIFLAILFRIFETFQSLSMKKFRLSRG